jgi:magnesium transporter
MADQLPSALPKAEPGLVAAAVYAKGKRVAKIAVEEAGKWQKKAGHVIWIGLFEPDHELLKRVQQQLNLHQLAIEDAEQAHQHPKIAEYGDALFIVARTAQMVSGKIAFGETHLFVGRGYLVSVRHGASATYGTVRQHCESCPKALSHGEDYILYKILDFIVDNYMPVVDVVRREIEELEDRVLHETVGTQQVQRLYALRRELLKLRNAVVPLVDICRRLEHAELLPIDGEMRSHFRDVTDHIQRVQEGIDSLREVLAFAFEASLMMGQAQQSAITRKLAAWAAILAVPTALAGIYGMNFQDMPELRWHYGYFYILAVILALCGYLYYQFKQKDWL